MAGLARAAEEELSLWLQQVVAPIDRLLAQVINPFPAQLRELSADGAGFASKMSTVHVFVFANGIRASCVIKSSRGGAT